MRIEDICEKLQDLLDLHFNALKFDVRSPNAPKLNSVIEDGEERNPLMVEGGEGDYEPYPNILINSPTFTCHMLVKADDLSLGYQAHEKLAELLVGKCMVIGSEMCITNLSNLVVGQLALLDSNSFGLLNSQINAIYGRQVKDLSYWLMLDFSIYCTTAKNAGGMETNDNGIIFGNQVTNTLSFTHGGTTYTENYVNVSTDHAMTAASYSQQGLTQNETAGTETNVAYGEAVSFPLRNNAFGLKMAELYRTKDYNGLTVTLTTKITLGTNQEVILFNDNSLKIDDIQLKVEPGEILEWSISLSKRLGVGDL